MELTLRKAAAVAELCKSTAKNLVLAHTIAVSVYSQRPVAEIIADGAKLLEQNINEKSKLLSATYELRRQISEANTKSGIDTLLNEKVRLDQVELSMSAVSQMWAHHDSDDNEPNIIEAKLDKMKIDLNSPTLPSARSYGSSNDKINVVVITEELNDKLTSELSKIRKRKIAIADELLVLNTTTRIVVPDHVEAILKVYDLL
jgi:hypothetical protein